MNNHKILFAAAFIGISTVAVSIICLQKRNIDEFFVDQLMDEYNLQPGENIIVSFVDNNHVNTDTSFSGNMNQFIGNARNYGYHLDQLFGDISCQKTPGVSARLWKDVEFWWSRRFITVESNEICHVVKITLASWPNLAL